MPYNNDLFGSFLQTNVFPAGVSVAKLAKLLGVKRPTLSKLLNGRSPMSKRMAKKIAEASSTHFTAAELLAKQEEFEKTTQESSGQPRTMPSKLVVPYLQISSTKVDGWGAKLESWADTIKARRRLAVLLRTLIHSTGMQLETVKFPGNDDSEISGWDGFVEAGIGTPWIPVGTSGWEFGVGGEPESKATRDINNRHAQLIKQGMSAEHLKEITFVFVTPRKWRGKEDWIDKQAKAGRWKNVRAYDASDLEQWIEQSIPGQIWLANELDIDSTGTRTLPQCWKDWKGNTLLNSLEALFDPAVQEFQEVIKEKLSSDEPSPITVVGDSIRECLAFLYCVFTSIESELGGGYFDRLVVFNSAQILEKLISDNAPFIPIIVGTDVERRFNPYRSKTHSIIVYPRGLSPSQMPDIVLRPLHPRQFENALDNSGASATEIAKLYNSSGGSLTVLPRWMSDPSGLEVSRWSDFVGQESSLVSFMFAGQWNFNNKADVDVLKSLSASSKYEDLERQIISLLKLDESPVWKSGPLQGVISQLDTMYSVFRDITRSDIERFFETFTRVFSDEGLGEDEEIETSQSSSVVSNVSKLNGCSFELQSGMLDFIVILSIYGESLVADHVDSNIKSHIGKTVRFVLERCTKKNSYADVEIFPELAEAAPNVFLDFIEEEIDQTESRVRELISQSEKIAFGYRETAGLFQALEGLAWNPKFLSQTTEVLIKLLKSQTGDYLESTAFQCLSNIFTSRQPQTFASVDLRIKVIKNISTVAPEKTWDFCLSQIDGSAFLDKENYKFRWGYPEEVELGSASMSEADARKFLEFCAEIVMARSSLSNQEVGKILFCLHDGDLLDFIGGDIPTKLWKQVEKASGKLKTSERIWIREQIRQEFVIESPELLVEGGNKNIDKNAQRIFDELASIDPVHKHCWLFADTWVTQCASEIVPDYDFSSREQQILELRLRAIQEIVLNKGILGIRELIELGCSPWVLGTVFSNAFEPISNVTSTLLEILKDNTRANREKWAGFFRGLLSDSSKYNSEFIANLIQNLDFQTKMYVLMQCPFEKRVWDTVDAIGGNFRTEYWKKVQPFSSYTFNSDLEAACDCLHSVGRAGKAFELISRIIENVSGKVVYKVLNNLVDDFDKFNNKDKLSEDDLLRAFRYLNTCTDVSYEKKAILELHCIEIFCYGKRSVPNLDRLVEQNPGLFVQAVSFSYRRSDNGEDPEIMKPKNEKEAFHRSKKSNLMLEKIFPFPRLGARQKLQERIQVSQNFKIKEWVSYVRRECKKLGREEVGDYEVGKYLAKLPKSKDGIWPAENLRDEVEVILSESARSGVAIGLYNLLGPYKAHSGGNTEHHIAEKYREQANKLREDFYRIARALDKVADMYESAGKRFDLEEVAMQRMRII